MKTRDFAAQHIRFQKTTPVVGPFRMEMYPFLGKPMDASDDIRVKRLVILKAASCLGTVLGQVINAKRIVCDVGDQLMICQTDDDASKWAKTRGKEWLESIPAVMRLLKQDKYSQTQELWLFRHKFLGISGPGINSAQSVQVRYVQTDESHLDAYPPGRLIEFEKRMGARFDRQSTHITTAADEGKEVDLMYFAGDQNEWHWRCSKCQQLVWPLWNEDSKREYNGERIFHWRESQSETETLDSITAICPHCQAEHKDNARERYALVREGDYVAKNPTAPIETASFRWSVFAAHWIPWRETLAEHLVAMRAALDGNLKPLEDFTKKRLCMSWRARLPDFGDGRGSNNYKVGDAWQVDDSVMILTADYQAGKRDEGSHFHALVTQWDRAGNSRRIAYSKVLTFGALDAIQAEFNIQSRNVAIESGHDNRFIFRECGRRKWYCTRGSDDTQILQRKTIDKKVMLVPMPYSSPEPQSGVIGERQPDRLQKVTTGTLPPGWAYCIVLCNPTLFACLASLIGGLSGRYFGIASDFPTVYVENMPAFVEVIEKDKKTQKPKSIWRQVREAHYWHCEVIAITVAARAGYFPFAGSYVVEQQTEKAA